MQQGGGVTSDRPSPRRYAPPAGRNWYAEALRHHDELTRAHGPLLADVLMDGHPDVIDRAGAYLWALSPLAERRRLAVALALAIGLAAFLAFLASLASFNFVDVVTSPLALSPLDTRAGPAGWLGP